MRRRPFPQIEGDIPPVRYEATYIYLTEDGTWPKNPIAIIPKDLDWMQEETYVAIRDLRPSSVMGSISHVRVLEVRPEIHVSTGRYSQVIRRVLVTPVMSLEETNKAIEEENDELPF
jgi:hypothetical protein